MDGRRLEEARRSVSLFYFASIARETKKLRTQYIQLDKTLLFKKIKKSFKGILNKSTEHGSIKPCPLDVWRRELYKGRLNT